MTNKFNIESILGHSSFDDIDFMAKHQKQISPVLHAPTQQQAENNLLALIEDGYDIHQEEEGLLRYACKDGNLTLVKFILESPLIKDKAKILDKEESNSFLACMHNILNEACQSGNINLVRYLLTVQKEYTNIHLHDEIVLKTACYNGNYQLVDFLLFSDEISDHSSFNDDFDLYVKEAYEKNYLKLFQYFLLNPKLRNSIDILNNQIAENLLYRQLLRNPQDQGKETYKWLKNYKDVMQNYTIMKDFLHDLKLPIKSEKNSIL